MSMSAQNGFAATRRSSLGFTLVELMIAMLLGLILIGGVVSVFLANKQSYRTNEALSQIQDGSRVAFELLARDIRQAGGTPCGNTTRVANVLNGATGNWYAGWGQPVFGVTDATTVNNPALPHAVAPDATHRRDAVVLLGTGDLGIQIVPGPSANPAVTKIVNPTNNLATGDIVMACDRDHATIFQVTTYNSNNVSVTHNSGSKGSPGNCTKGLDFPVSCGNVGATTTFTNSAYIAKFYAHYWYIGQSPNAPQGVYSLYRASFPQGAVQADEIVRGVQAMQVLYHEKTGANAGKYVTATNVVNWANVDAVQLTLTLQSVDSRAGATEKVSDSKPLIRSFTTTITLRNRV